MLKYSTYRSIYNETNANIHCAANRRLSLKKSLVSLMPRLLQQGVIMKLILVLMLAVSGFTVVGNVFAGSVSMMKEEKRIVVEPGDTLWSIAREHKPLKMNTNIYIEGIKESNGMRSSNIQAGDVLILPLY